MIFIHEATDKIIQQIEDVIDDLNNDKIYLFSDLLDKKSKLRSLFEKSKNSGIIACYIDNEITIKKLISQKLSILKGFNLTSSASISALFITGIPDLAA